MSTLFNKSTVWHLLMAWWLGLLILLATPLFAAEPAQAPLFPGAKYETPFNLSYDDAEKAVGDALISKGVGNKVTASITGLKDGPIYSSAKPVTVDVRGLIFEAQDHRWSANLLMMSNGEVVTAMPAAGKYEEILEVPVLRRMVRAGDIIGLGDVEIRDVPLLRTRPDTITDLAALIGKSPVRSISPERPIRVQEIAEPAVVKKNGLVQMRYSSPGMEIMASGQAIDEGAIGDVISVRNTTSKKIVRAVIEDANNVNIVVTASPTQTSQLEVPNVTN